MANKQHIFKGVVPPASAPIEVGHHYIDTVAKVMYLAVGTASVGDWQVVGSGGAAVWGAITGTLSAQTDLQSALNAKLDVPAAANNQLIYQNNSGVIVGLADYFVDTFSGGLGVNKIIQPNDGTGFTYSSENVSFDPLQNSPNENWNIHNVNIQFDINNTGFSQGTNGNAIQIYNLGFTHSGTGEVGGLVYHNLTANIGNGTDPLTANGMFLVASGINYNPNVTLNNGVQGFGFNINVNSSAIKGSNFYVNAFTDFSQVQIPVDGYNVFVANPNILEITTNHNFNGFNINPTITTFTGNAGAVGYGMYGTYTTMSANGGIIGFQANPTITTMGANGYFHGMDLNGVFTTTHGNIQGININFTMNAGDAQFSGIQINPNGTANLAQVKGIDISLNNILSQTQKNGLNVNDGMLTAYSNYDTSVLPASPGFMQLHALGGLFTVSAGNPMSNTLVFANNFGMASLFNDSMGPDAFGGFLGFCAQGLVSQVAVDAGKTVDTYTATAIASSVPGVPTTGGTITNANVLTVGGIIPSGGSLSITNLKGVYIPNFFNSFSATNAWGVYVADITVDNWFAKNIVIGGVTGKSAGGYALDVTGNALFENFIYGLDDNESIDTNNRLLMYNGTTAANWQVKSLIDDLGFDSIYWDARQLLDSASGLAIDWSPVDSISVQKALVLAKMNTATRDALTALQGMIIFNTDTLVAEVYNGTTWV